MAAIASAVQNSNSSAYSNGERRTFNESKKEDMSDDDDIPLSRKARMIVDDDDIPLAKKLKTMKNTHSDDDDDVPLSQKAKPQKGLSEEAVADASSSRVKKSPLLSSTPSSARKVIKAELESDDDVPLSVRAATLTKKRKKVNQTMKIINWRWEEEKKPSGIKWYSLSHKGPIFAPPYVPLPESVHFKYDGKVMKLTPLTEEVASFYAKILEHEYTTKETFNKNFFMDWRKVMTPAEREKITDLTKCDFREMHAHYVQLREERRSLSKEDKQKIKEAKQEEAKMYGVAYIDGHKQKIGNFRIEPPDLFRGRGGHPKMGRLKRRINPEDVIINCSKDSEIPKPPEGHRWKEVRHDNTVTWLCSWTDNILGSIKYIMLNPSSKIKGEKDYEKFETARRLKDVVENIRENYTKDLKSKEMRVRQRAVALYFIDKLALRAGNEKDVDEAADTVGCCSLRCEHIQLHEKLDDNDYVVEFDFLGKDSIRYYNKVPVEKRVFKNLKLFMENKSGNDDLFDRLDTASLNKYLQSLMPGLTAKVFRTYNASITLQQQLEKLTKDDSTVPELLLCYNRANRQVAILCNHQRAVPKSHEKSMENLKVKIKTKKAELKEAKEELEKARGDVAKQRASKRVDRIKEQLRKLKIQRTDKDENKQIALSTSKLNYLDPRISVAWCKKYEVPIEKIFNKTQREKFRWAIDMADEDYVF
ncbi:DNA topoisomerase I [Loa loa]|uniref:DNA topoisomerase I n=1 Tax=Loa loa TaxID=7209 RepID=A0A1S0TRP7_LOALO|nr:DNA topoisomerase I [Loa loa]EFO18685.1 DNA topoisomerase I [Loa loa]